MARSWSRVVVKTLYPWRLVSTNNKLYLEVGRATAPCLCHPAGCYCLCDCTSGMWLEACGFPGSREGLIKGLSSGLTYRPLWSRRFQPHVVSYSLAFGSKPWTWSVFLASASAASDSVSGLNWRVESRQAGLLVHVTLQQRPDSTDPTPSMCLDQNVEENLWKRLCFVEKMSKQAANSLRLKS